MEKEFIQDTYVFESSSYNSTHDNASKAILRTVQGPVAEYGTLNRNKRMYTEKLWDNVLSSPYVQEQLSYHTLYGESGHPQDRYEVDFGRVTHSITKLWKVPEKNQIFATIHILNTPMGKILDTLYEAGGIIGYSSRAGGQLYQRRDHVDVDEKTYNFITFDAVPYPSVVAARPGVIDESTLEKVSLPDNVHDKLCGIILENKNNDQLKDFIYSITGFDMSREMRIYESSNPVSYNVPADTVKVEQKISEATMQLIKESSSKIESLTADNVSLRVKNSTIQTENENLKVRLDESLKQITDLSQELKEKDRKVSESVVGRDDTIVSLKNRINNLESILEDKDLELEEVNGMREAVKVLQQENKGMKSSLYNEKEISESYQARNLKAETELKESYSEICKMVKELGKKDMVISRKDKEISNLTESVSNLKSSLKNISEEVKSLKSEKSTLVNESKKFDSKSSNTISRLKEENSRLIEEVQKLSNSITESSKITDYSEDLVSVVAGMYGIAPSRVLKNLHEGFTKDDVYRVCESMSNSAIKGVSYENITESVTVKNTTKNDKGIPNAPRIESIMVNAGNRRGIGMLK